MQSSQKTLTPALIWLMAISSGLVVANNYYNQPLLSLIASEFRIAESEAGKIPMLTQIGYAAGLVVIVPLGDLLERRKLILIDFIFILLAVLGLAFSTSVFWLFTFSFLIGFTSVIPQVFVPLAASLSKPEKRTQNIGLVMSGLLIGILGSRILSGWVGQEYGWRSMYYLAAGLLVIMWLMLFVKLPKVLPAYKGTYKQLVESMVFYFRTESVLREASLKGALAFAAFSSFWTILAFHLAAEPFNASSTVAGSFGALGMLGALMAAVTGKLARRFSANLILLNAIGLFLLSWIIFAIGGTTYLGLIIGVIILDVAMQAIHIMNQSSIFALHPEANSRINTVYMVSYFLGGALGTYLSSLSWQSNGWMGVVLLGSGFTVALLVVQLFYSRAGKRKLAIA